MARLHTTSAPSRISIVTLAGPVGAVSGIDPFQRKVPLSRSTSPRASLLPSENSIVNSPLSPPRWSMVHPVSPIRETPMARPQACILPLA